MSDVNPAPENAPGTDAALAAKIAELEATVAGLQQTVNTGQGGTFPHTAVAAGSPAHLHLGPVDEHGFVLPGHWGTDGLWVDDAAAATV